MEEPGGLQSMGLQRVGHDWATSLSTCSVRNLYVCGIMCSAPEECSLNQLASRLLKPQVSLSVSLLTSYLEMSVMILDPKETSSIWKTKLLRRLSETLLSIILMLLGELVNSVSWGFFLGGWVPVSTDLLAKCHLTQFSSNVCVCVTFPCGLMYDNL